MTMKKTVIKRRKRVIPASHGAVAEAEDLGDPMDTDEAHGGAADGAPERGSVNSDGSVNLGMRRRLEHSPLSILPEPLNQTASPRPSGDLAAYQTSPLSQFQPRLDSLSDQNRLAPITSLTTTADRQSSLSPASFLSPSRKRSFSSTETGMITSGDTGQDSSTKRLSSIKSILNPAGTEAGQSSRVSSRDDEYGDSMQRSVQSPSSTTPSAPSPGAYSNAVSTPGLAAAVTTRSRDAYNESDISKAERRAALQREADRMREMLAEKERELAELGND